mgnify:CR=1 FL=1
MISRGVLFAERLVIEPQGRQEARPEGFQNDVRCRRQAPEKPAAVCGFQIEGNAALGRVVVPERQAALRVRDVVEERPDVAAGLAAGRFDLDHIGPEIAEQLAAELALFIRELQDPRGLPAGPAVGWASLTGASPPCRKARPLCRPERAVGEACAELFVAVAQQAFDNLPGVLTDQRARQVIRRRGFREFERGILHLVHARAPDAPSADTSRR